MASTPAPCVASTSRAAPRVFKAGPIRPTIDEAAVRPVDRRERGQRHGCRALTRDCLKNRRRPIAIRRTPDGFDREALAFRPLHPLENRRGVVVLDRQHARALRDGQHLGRGRYPVSDGRDQRHVVGRGVDQPGRRKPRPLVLLGGERCRQLPGLAFARDGGTARLLHGDRQRTPGRSIEIADVAGDIELGTLGC